MKKVYLAGPITGCNYDEASEWRETVKIILRYNDLDAFSPMRGKSHLVSEGKIEGAYDAFPLSSIIGINVRDYNDCKTADGILVNLIGATTISIGTVMEIAWARAFQIPCVIAMEEDNVHAHCMLQYGNIIVRTLQEAADTISELLNS